jgi:hypothetical protein
MNRGLVVVGRVLPLVAAGGLLAAPDLAQEGNLAPRAPEGTRIITLPSAEPPPKKTLQVLFTHRFVQPVGDSDYQTLFSFDSGADIGIGISYSPIENLEVSLDRSSNQDDYELAFKYRLLRSTESRPFLLSFRVGGNARTERGIEDRTAFFAQGIAAVALGSRVRITAIPTYVSNTPLFQDVFNLPIALSVGVTRTVNIQAELVPRNRDFGASRVGWLVAIEKSVLRHRFAWTAGNLRATTVDQYAASDFGGGLPAHDIYVGFNLVRQWKLK